MELPTALTHEIHQLLSGLSIDDAPVVDPIAKLHAALSSGIDSYRGFQLEMVDHGHPVTLTWFAGGTVADHLTTSLRLPLTALIPTPTPPAGTAMDPGSITFYASTPGALVDFAADITYALHLPPPRTGPAGHGHTNGHVNGHTNGHVNGHTNGHTNGHVNGHNNEHTNGHVNGHVNGHTNGHTREPEWRGITLDGGIPPTTMVTGLAGVTERSAINRAIGVLLAEGYEIEPAFDELGRRAAVNGHSLTQHATELLARVSSN